MQQFWMLFSVALLAPLAYYSCVPGAASGWWFWVAWVVGWLGGADHT